MKKLKIISFLVFLTCGLQARAQITDIGTMSCQLEKQDQSESFDLAASFKTDNQTVKLILMKLMTHKSYRNFPFVIERIRGQSNISGNGYFFRSMSHEDRFKRDKRSFSFNLNNQNLTIIMGQERLNCSHKRKDYSSIQEIYQTVVDGI